IVQGSNPTADLAASTESEEQGHENRRSLAGTVDSVEGGGPTIEVVGRCQSSRNQCLTSGPARGAKSGQHLDDLVSAVIPGDLEAGGGQELGEAQPNRKIVAPLVVEFLVPSGERLHVGVGRAQAGPGHLDV